MSILILISVTIELEFENHINKIEILMSFEVRMLFILW